MAEAFLEINQLRKAYDQHVAVDTVSLQIPRGRIYGLLGPNGAGKTTIIRMITGIIAPDSGQIFFDGQALTAEHTRKIGYMPEERGLYKKMKVREQIIYLLNLRGMNEKQAAHTADEWLEKLSLSEWANRKTMDLSKGMQQKVQFITTIGHKPRLLILDEPFSGLDPVNTQLIEKEIRKMQSEGTTIIFSTHRMEQVEELCDYIALINKGQKLIEDGIQEVRRKFQKQVYKLEFNGDNSALAQLEGIEILEQTDKVAMLELKEGHSSRQLMHQLADSPLEILQFALHLPRLNEIFIELVQN